jgi:hypothetical protein
MCPFTIALLMHHSLHSHLLLHPPIHITQSLCLYITSFTRSLHSPFNHRYSGDAIEALKHFNRASRDAEYGPQALKHMIEIFLNPNSAAEGGECVCLSVCLYVCMYV